MPLRLPPHIAWPLFVIVLLCLSVATVTVTVIASRSDGGAQVVEDYYRKAVTWDEAVARQAASDALGWEADVTAHPPPIPDGPRRIVVTIHDRDGAPVAGLEGTITGYRPQRSRPVTQAVLTPAPDAPGVYHPVVAVADAGLWDFEIAATRDSLHFQTTLRVDVE